MDLAPPDLCLDSDADVLPPQPPRPELSDLLAGAGRRASTPGLIVRPAHCGRGNLRTEGARAGHELSRPFRTPSGRRSEGRSGTWFCQRRGDRAQAGV